MNSGEFRHAVNRAFGGAARGGWLAAFLLLAFGFPAANPAAARGPEPEPEPAVKTDAQEGESSKTPPADQPPADEALLAPSQEFDDPPAPFVPLNPRTVEERQRLEAIQDYVAARSLERRRQLGQARLLLLEAIRKDPNNAAIHRRLTRVCLALGQIDRAYEACKTAVSLDPNDSESIQMLLLFTQRTGDLADQERVLNEILANPKLKPDSGAALLALRNLGLLLAMRPDRREEAADALEKVVAALDRKEAEQLSPGEMRRILGEPASAYGRFGEVLLEAGRFDAARLAFERGLVYSPDDPNLKTGLARVSLRGDRPERTLELIESVARTKPRVPVVYRTMVEAYDSLGRRGEALPKLESMLKEDADNPALQAVLASELANAGRKKEAIDLFLKGLRRPGGAGLIGAESEGLRTLGRLLIEENRTDELLEIFGLLLATPNGMLAAQPLVNEVTRNAEAARRAVERGTDLLSEDPPKLDARLMIALSEIAATLKDGPGVIRLARLATRRDPKLQTYLELYTALNEYGQPGEAAGALGEIVEKFAETRNPRTYVMLAQAKLRAKDFEGAATAALEARRLGENDPEMSRYAGYILSQAGKHEEAVAIGRALIEADANDSKGRQMLFQALVEAERLPEALALAEASMKLDPENPDHNAMLGDALELSGREDEAVEHLRKALARFEDDPENELRIGQRLSALLVKLNRNGPGREVLEVLYAKYPDDPGVNNDLGYLYAEQGIELEKAESMVRLALRDDPENASYLDSLGWALFKQGRHKEAVEYLERAVKNYPLATGSATLWDHLGDAYFELKEYGKAREAWRKAEEIAASDKPPDRRLEDIRRKFKLLDQVEADGGARPAEGEAPRP